MPDKIFKYKKATITVRAKRGSDVIDNPRIGYELIQSLCNKLNIDRKTKIESSDLNDLVWAKVTWFSNLLICSSIKGDLGFPWPEEYLSTPETRFKAYEDLMNGDPELIELWAIAYNEANMETISPEE